MLNNIAAGMYRRMTLAGVANPPSAAVIYYALQIVTNTVSIVVGALLIGTLTGEIDRAAQVLFTFAVIRYLSGGYHLPTNFACIATSTALMATIPHLHLTGAPIHILTAISTLSFALFAPSNYDKYARVSRRYYPHLRALTVGLVAANFVIQSDILAFTYIIQAVLLPLGKLEEGRK